jgi:hypothetical protein
LLLAVRPVNFDEANAEAAIVVRDDDDDDGGDYNLGSNRGRPAAVRQLAAARPVNQVAFGQKPGKRPKVPMVADGPDTYVTGSNESRTAPAAGGGKKAKQNAAIVEEEEEDDDDDWALKMDEAGNELTPKGKRQAYL